jgi:hypothetical protein
MPSLVQIDLVDFLMMLCLYTGEKEKEIMHHKFTMDDERHQVLAKAHMTLNVDSTSKSCDKTLPLVM